VNLEDIIEKRGQHCQEELRFARNLVLSSHPAITESIKYGLPFFSLKKILAYMDVQKGKPLIAFMNARHFGELSEVLDFTNRTRVGHFSLVDFSEERSILLASIIDAAIEFDLKKSARR
jgi:hypothetical protein